MRSKVAVLASLLAFATLGIQSPRPADACGVKLTVKPSAPRKAVPRSSNPSQVLLVGAPPRRLEHDLQVAGHKVEVTKDPSSAKRDQYAVVIADNDQQATAARAKYPNAVVMVRSGDTGADLRAVEDKVARTPVAVIASREPVKAKETRTPVAAGPDSTDRVAVAAKPVDETPAPAPTPPPRPTAPTPPPRPAVAEAKPEPKPVESKKPGEEQVTTTPSRPVEQPAPKPVVATAAEVHEEVFFSLGSKNVRAGRGLTKALSWLKSNPTVNVTLAGHADPSGTPEGNMELSRQRAEAVKDFLVGKGIDASRIDVQAFGDTQLKYGAKDGRNRRVAIDAAQ
jgi:outer membrane protein OmpA-like peptidoglycan-associated protein